MAARRHSGSRAEEENGDADKIAAADVRHQRAERQQRRNGIEPHRKPPAKPGAQDGAGPDREEGAQPAFFAGACQRSAALSSASFASTQRAPSARCSFFQNGARVLR